MDKDLHKDHRQRLRERFDNDPKGFSKHELLELLLFYAIPRHNVNPIAHKLIDKYGSLTQVLHANAEDIAEVDGIGPSAATYLTVLGRALDIIATEEEEQQKIYSFEKCKSYFLKVLGSLDTERFCAIFLSKSDKIIMRKIYTDESENSVSVDTIPFVKSLVNPKISAVVIAHNHPSGNPTPSRADDLATEKLAMLFALNGVKLYDHVIVGGNEVYSYRMDERLEKILNSANRRFEGL